MLTDRGSWLIWKGGRVEIRHVGCGQREYQPKSYIVKIMDDV